MPNPRTIVRDAFCFVRRNPDKLWTIATSAAGLKIAIPIAALQYFLTNLKGKKAPKEIVLETASPGLRVGATVNAMQTVLRVGGVVTADRVEVAADSFRVALRVDDLKLAVIGESEAPIATLVKSGALDLSKPGNLLKYLPKRPAMIVEAEGNRILLDLMKVESLKRKIGPIAKIFSSALDVRSVRVEGAFLVIAFGANARGAVIAVERVVGLLRERLGAR